MSFYYDGFQMPHYHRRRRSFEQTYVCYPASTANKPHMEGGDKVILPQSALALLNALRIEYPMLFQLHNAGADRTSHCGVLEFSSDEGFIIMPSWMMRNMRLEAGALVAVKNAAPPKATFVKLRPHETAFVDVSNPKAVLEKTLRHFSCLTTGDTIMVAYNDRQYYIDIVETKPAAAVCVIDTDCEVDFAPPLDYKEPEKPKQAVAPASSKAVAEDQSAVVEPEFKPFTGCGKRLDGGRVSEQQAPKVSASATGSAPPGSIKSAIQQTEASTSSARPKTGKLVFGSGASSKKELQKGPVKQSEPVKKEEPKFQAFTGKSYSLMK